MQKLKRPAAVVLNDPLFRPMRLVVFISAVFLFQSTLGQGDTSRLSFRLNGGLIMGRTFSNYPLNPEQDSQSSTSFEPVDTVSMYRPGFYLGLDGLFLPGEAVKILIGLSLSHTSAAYRSVYTSSGPTNRTGYTQLDRTTENNYSLRYTALNVQAGLRIRLYDHFAVTPSLLFNRPLRIMQESKGYTQSIYTGAGGTDSGIIYFAGARQPLKEKESNLSFRLDLAYKFQFGENAVEAHLFRNFGLIYALAWWGIGLSVGI